MGHHSSLVPHRTVPMGEITERVLTFALIGASLSQWLWQAGLFLRVAAMGPCCLLTVLFILFGLTQF